MPNRRPAAGDICYGVKAVAAHLGVKPRQALHLIETNRLPCWREGRAILARRSSLDDWAEQREAEARASVAAA